MPHIHTQPGQHDHTITCYIIRVDGDEPRTLVHMHRKLGKLLPVGGHIELDETPWQAAAHEIAEESGYALNQLMILQPPERIHALTNSMLHPQPLVAATYDITPDHFHSDISYALVATGDPNGEPDEGESTDMRWLTRAEVRSLSSDEVWENTKETCEFIFGIVLPNWEQVPTSDFTIKGTADFYGHSPISDK